MSTEVSKRLEALAITPRDVLRVTLVDVDMLRFPVKAELMLADIPPQSRVATKQLENIQIVDGVLYADSVHFPEVGNADYYPSVLCFLWLDTGDDRTSPILAGWGQSGVDNGVFGSYPILANGGTISIIWNADGVMAVAPA